MPRIDLNCDLGEGGSDDALLALCGRANIATGGHAGNDDTMHTAMVLAVRHGVLVGAHPSYPDRDGFGRRELNHSVETIIDDVREQLTRFNAIAADLNVHVAHVKPHGALYHRAGHDAIVAQSLVQLVRNIDPALALVGQPFSALARECSAAGQPFLGEFFADRRYEADGTLTPRSHPVSVLHDPMDAIMQVREMMDSRSITARTGEHIHAGSIDTVCVHGDGTSAVPLLAMLREVMDRAAR